MSRPLQTVLIDTYNQEAFIEDAVNSVLGQGFPASEMEVLVIDDGSTDRTPEIVGKFEPRVRLLRKSNGGQGSAFNVGIAEARGEIVAFLDGDDWWAPGKLSAIHEVFASDSAIGLVGHGITEVHLDGRRREELPRATCRFRISSVAEARKFTRLRAFLGTSRMAYRRDILRRIGLVPDALTFEADEYLFTLAAFFTDMVVLSRSLTFYRLHQNNLYQTSAAGGAQAVRKKQRIMAELAQLLRQRLQQEKISACIAGAVLDCINVEADVLRLMTDSGFPWETVSTELKIMRLFYSDQSFWQHAFTCARLLPALALPARTYYRWRSRVSRSTLYHDLRRKLLPFPVPGNVKRTDKPAP